MLDDQPASPAWFQASPVYTYAGEFMSYVASREAAGTYWGMPVARRPSQEPLVFTAKRLAVILHREVIIPRARLTDFESK